MEVDLVSELVSCLLLSGLLVIQVYIVNRPYAEWYERGIHHRARQIHDRNVDIIIPGARIKTLPLELTGIVLVVVVSRR